MNSLYLIALETILCLIFQIIIYKKYKTVGLYAYVIVCVILSCLMSLKTITLFNFDVNLGIIPFTTIFTAYNILIQKNGEEISKNLILTMSATFIISYFILYFVHFMNSSNINLFTNASYDNIFIDSARIYFANFVVLLYSLLLNSKLYFYLKKMKNNILISNLFSTIIIQFIAAIIFGLTAYIFVKELIDILKIIMIRYLMSLVVGILGTISIYTSNKAKD